MDANKEALERVLEDAKMHYPDDSGWWRPDDIPTVRAYVSKLENALFAISQAPFPLHDYCTQEEWEFACNFVASRREA